MTTEIRERLIKRTDGTYVSEDGRFHVYKGDRGYGYTIEDRERFVARWLISRPGVRSGGYGCETRDWTVNTLAEARESIAKWRDHPEGPDAGYKNMLDAIDANGATEARNYRLSENAALNLAHVTERIVAGDTSEDTLRRMTALVRTIKRKAREG